MCTVTWIHEDGGYQLFCNRDEKRKRLPAAPPRLEVRGGVRFLAPTDGDFGGTWVATNEFGVSVCLLNGPPGSSTRSRGLLVLNLIPLRSVASLAQGLQALDLSVYAPFRLAALEPGKPAAVMEWNGSQRTIQLQAEVHFMLTSSSFDTLRVREARGEEYSRLTRSGCDADVLSNFHHSHGAVRSAYSVCMHRPDAETVSFSRIRVNARETEFSYIPAAPCVSAQAAIWHLARSGVE